MNLKQLVYKPGQELIGYYDSNYMYTINGICYGKVKDKIVYAKSGKYIGEFNAIGFLVSEDNESIIESFYLAENQTRLPKRFMIIGICKKLGTLAKPLHGGAANQFNEYPCTEELEKLAKL